MDINSISDEELLAIVGSPQEAKQTTSGVSSMSDEELMALVGSPEKEQTPSINGSPIDTSMFETIGTPTKEVIPGPAELGAKGEALTTEQAGLQTTIPVVGGVGSTVANLVGEGAATIGIETASAALGEDFKKNYPTATSLIEGGVGLTAALLVGSPKDAFTEQSFEEVFGSRGVSELLSEYNSAKKFLVNSGKYDAKQVDELTKTVPLEDKVFALAMGTEDEKFLNFVKQTLEDNKIANKMGAMVNNRRDVLEAVTKNQNDLKSAKDQWDVMMAKAGEITNPIQVSEIGNSLKYVDNLYGASPSKAGSVIARLKLAESDTTTLTEILDLRKAVNRQMSKAAKGTDELKHWDSIKTNLDNVIAKETGGTELNELINSTISNYSRVKNNVNLDTLIAKNTSNTGAVDYNKLLQSINTQHLDSPEVKKAVELAKEFESKFKLDPALGKSILAGGSSKSNQQFYLGQVGRWIIDNLTPWNVMFNESRYKGLKIQNAIENSIKNSNTSREFFDKLNKSYLPEDIKKGLPKDYVPIKVGDKELQLIRHPDTKSFSLDLQSLDVGSGQGKEAYFKSWDMLSEAGEKYSPGVLTGNNEYKYYLNKLEYLRNNPDTEVFGAKTTNLTKNAITNVIDELNKKGLDIREVDDVQLQEFAKQTGPDMSLGVRSLQMLKESANFMDNSKGSLEDYFRGKTK